MTWFSSVPLSLQADYAFIASLAYLPADGAEVQNQLNAWFGNGMLKVNDALIKDFRSDFPFERYEISRDSHVSYTLLQNVIDPTRVLITVRGTATVLDLMADAQIWISAVLFQALREFLPLGSSFTPILHHVVRIVNRLETAAITKVTYYQEIREFALWLKEKNYNARIAGECASLFTFMFK